MFSLIAVAIFQPMATFAQAEADTTTGCSWFNVFCHMEKAFHSMTQEVGYVIGYIAAALMGIAVGLIQVLIQMSAQLTSNILVTTGFKITLDLANLGFVLGIIVVAYATILRTGTYTLKQTLSKLIVAAILINFSFAIAGLFIDFSNVLGFYFIKEASSGNILTFGENLANSLNLQKLSGGTGIFNFKDMPDGLAGFLSFGSSYLESIATITITAIFSVLIVIVFFAIAFMLLIRHLYLTVLLIMMPIAWLFWAFPNWYGLWGKWWDKFLQWNIFLPVVSFFIYLSIISSQKIGELVGSSAQGLNTLDAASSLTAFNVSGMQAIVQTIVQAGLLFAGLMVANSLGISGASAAMKMAGSVKNTIIGAAGKVTRAPAEYLGTRPTKALARAGATVLSSRPLRWIPGAQGTANRLAGLGQRQKEVEEYQKQNFGNLTNAQLENYKTALPQGPIARASLLAEAAKRKMLNKFSDEQITSLAVAAQQANPGMPPQNIPAIKEVLSINPLLAPKLTKNQVTVKAAIEKIQPAKMADIENDVLKNKEAVTFFSQQQLNSLVRFGSDEKVNTLKQTIIDQLPEELKKLNVAVTSTYEDLREAKATGDEKEIKRLQTQLKTFVNTLRTEKDKIKTAEGGATKIKLYDQLSVLNQTVGNNPLS